MSAPDPDLWRWSCAVYQREGVAAAALALQDDYGVNVNAALWAVWCALHGGAIDPDIAERAGAALQGFNPMVTCMIRAARHALRRPVADAPEGAAADLKAKLLLAELDAERIEQSLLQAVAPRPDRSASPAKNLEHIAAAIAGPGDAARAAALGAFCGAVLRASAALHGSGRVS
jgi:uncharacterized protein (TIGR02444 family)